MILVLIDYHMNHPRFHLQSLTASLEDKFYTI